MDLKRFTKEKSPLVKTKAKTGPKKKKSGEFGGEKKKILADSDKDSWFDQPSQIGEERNLEMNSVVLHPKVWWESVEKKIMARNLPEERKVMREPLSSASQDYSFPEISRHSRVPPCNRASALAPRFPLFFPQDCFVFVFPIDDYRRKACVQKTWPKL